ncbi:MAG: CotD family spore coat protein [Bacilli bacterium]
MLFNRNCNMNCNRPPMGGCCCNQPVVEPAINKCVEKEFCHEVQHVCPIHTHVINRHVYNHVYTPQYSISEENQIINNDQGSCCGF